MIKAIIFDYDGVIVNSLPIVYQAYCAISEKLNKIKFKSAQELGNFFNGDWKRTYKYLRIKEDEVAIAEKIYKEINFKLKNQVKPIKGMEEIIRKLSDKFELAIVTSNYREIVEEKLKKYNLVDFFSTIIDCNDVKKMKPEPEPLLKALKKMGLKPSEAIYVGDMDGDIIMSKKAKVKIAAVTYGWHSREKLEKLNPEIVLCSPEELLKLK